MMQLSFFWPCLVFRPSNASLPYQFLLALLLNRPALLTVASSSEQCATATGSLHEPDPQLAEGTSSGETKHCVVKVSPGRKVPDKPHPFVTASATHQDFRIRFRALVLSAQLAHTDLRLMSALSSFLSFDALMSSPVTPRICPFL